MKKPRKNFLPLVYAVFGVYFLNFGLSYFDVPEMVSKFDNWVIALGGILFFIAAYRGIIYSRKRMFKKAVKASK